MMTWAFLVFLVPFLAGLSVFRFTELSQRFSQDLLTFGGAFLFTITMLHLLPEVFAYSTDKHQSGFWLLMGFLVQIALEMFFGSEHDTNKLLKINPLPFIMAVFFHAFTEGGLLAFSVESSHHIHSAHEPHHHAHAGGTVLFLGILIHKIPTAMTIVSIFVAKYTQKRWAFLGLFVMVLATPLGIFMHEYLAQNQFLTQESGQILSALVAGSFLHVASILFFSSMHENTTQKYRKSILIITGTAIGMASEYLF